MRILYTAHRFWPAVGGTEQVVLSLAKEALKLGHEVTVATSAEPGSPPNEDVGGIHVRRFALRQFGKFRLPPKDYVPFVVNGPWDVVHVHGQRVWSSDHLFRHLGRIRALKVFTAHGFHQWHMHHRDPVELWYYKWHLPRMLREFDHVIALTEAELGELVSFGVDRRKVVIIPNGIDVGEFARAEETSGSSFREKYGIDPKNSMLLYAGGFYDNKGVPLLIDAVAALGRNDVELVIVGKDPPGGSTRPECEDIITRRKAPVRILGEIPRRDVLQAFQEADLFLLGSRFEGYGIVLLEAMAAGVPFVSTPAGAAPELAAQGAGVVARDAAGMARAIADLLGDPQKRAAMGARARTVAGSLTMEKAARRHLELYQGPKG